VGALAELRTEGKIRHVDLSNVTVEQIESVRKIVPVVSVQNEYNLAARGAQAEENVGAQTVDLSADDLAELDSYRLSTFDARSLARRFMPHRLRRVTVSVLRVRHSLRRR
jgi:aryl-alcohol dehydrogenase-like predicted oxidoreductase